MCLRQGQCERGNARQERWPWARMQETPMPQRRQRLADFEARSVQLIAACTLGLAGLASVPPAHAARVTGQTTSLTGTSGNTTSPGLNQPGKPAAEQLPADHR
eukprot:gene26248-47506_t